MRPVACRLLALCLCIIGMLWAPLGAACADEASSAPDPPVHAQPTPTPVKEGARLFIDNQNLYPGMEKSYSQGYMPTVEGGVAVVVLPLLCEGELQGGCLRARALLGDGPFIMKNYEKTVEGGENPVQGGRAVEGYCIVFPLQLQAERVNGSYPVTIEIMARDSTGPVEESFTVYVAVTDGVDPNATPTPDPVLPPPTEEPVPLLPKVMVQSYEAAPLDGGTEGPVEAGGRVRVRATLFNTSRTEGLENMSVTATAPAEYFSLESAADCLYIDALPAEGTVEVFFDYAVKPEAPAGQYEVTLSYDFAYHQGQVGAGTGCLRVNVAQPLKMEFSLLQMPAEAVISDTIEVGIQAVNPSRAQAYNVRATLEADGLSPSGTAFIGDLEGGAMKEVPLSVSITGLTASAFPYGQTSGIITYMYEDAGGTAYSQQGSFTLVVKSPFSESKPQNEDDPGQWWAVMGAVGAVLLAFGVLFMARAIRGRRE